MQKDVRNGVEECAEKPSVAGERRRVREDEESYRQGRRCAVLHVWWETKEIRFRAQNRRQKRVCDSLCVHVSVAEKLPGLVPV